MNTYIPSQHLLIALIYRDAHNKNYDQTMSESYLNKNVILEIDGYGIKHDTLAVSWMLKERKT